MKQNFIIPLQKPTAAMASLSEPKREYWKSHMLKTPDLVEYLKSSSTFFWSDVRIASIQIDASNIKSFIEGIINKMFRDIFVEKMSVLDTLLVW